MAFPLVPGDAENSEKAQDHAVPSPSKRPVNPNATRDHLANERTLLAWVRSCIAIVGLGFVIARFGLVESQVAGVTSGRAFSELSTGIGVLLIVSAAGLIFLATLRYRQTTEAIETNDYKPSTRLLIVLAASFILAAALLAIYLVLAG